MTVCAIRYASLLAALLGLSGCGEPDEPVEIEKRTREVAPFKAIDMEGAAHLEVAVGEPHSLTIQAPAAVIERLRVEVRDETLFIESRPRDWFPSQGGRRLILTIGTPQLSSLRLGGGNDANLRGFSGGETRIRAEGAAHVAARGRLDKLTVHMSGAANADLSRLLVADAKVTVDGVGNVVVHPTERLDATMNGIGAIHYLGDPMHVSTRMHGFGTIAKREGEPPPTQEPSSSEPIDPEKLQPEYEDTERSVDVEKEDVV